MVCTVCELREWDLFPPCVDLSLSLRVLVRLWCPLTLSRGVVRLAYRIPQSALVGVGLGADSSL